MPGCQRPPLFLLHSSHAALALPLNKQLSAVRAAKQLRSPSPVSGRHARTASCVSEPAKFRSLALFPFSPSAGASWNSIRCWCPGSALSTGCLARALGCSSLGARALGSSLTDCPVLWAGCVLAHDLDWLPRSLNFSPPRARTGSTLAILLKRAELFSSCRPNVQ